MEFNKQINLNSNKLNKQIQKAFMNKYLKYIILSILVLFILFSGCITININTSPDNTLQITPEVITIKNESNGTLVFTNNITNIENNIHIISETNKIQMLNLIGSWKNETRDIVSRNNEYLNDCYIDKYENKLCYSTDGNIFTFNKDGTGYWNRYIEYRNENNIIPFSYKLIDNTIEIDFIIQKDGIHVGFFKFSYVINDNILILSPIEILLDNVPENTTRSIELYLYRITPNDIPRVNFNN